jgi:hypothetical protein
MKQINYTAPPTCGRFMQSAAFGRLLAGPVGSGKTTACVFELLRRSCEQAQAHDGIRYTRFAIVRQTLKQLKDTVLKDILSWLEGMVSYKVSDNTVYISMGDVRSEWILIPLDSPEDQRRLLSMQLTGVWMSEAIEMPVDLVDSLAGRLGRYPSAVMGGATWFGMIADTNMPTEGSEWYKFMHENVAPDWQIFIQPGGLEENAENLNWLHQTTETMKLRLDSEARLAQGRSYYERLARGRNADWVLRYVHAKYGNDPSGTAVFRESFNRSFHIRDNVLPVSSQPIMVGQDFGRDPCSIIGQLDHKGRLLVLEEVIAEDIGLEKHIEQALRPRLMDVRYIGRPVAIIGDPSGISKSSIYEETTFDVIKRMGLHAFPAPTNDIDPRLRAVEAFLLGQRDGGPAFIIDRERCPVLVRALGGGYRYAKTRSGLRKLSPDKNEYSHVADALQYLCLAAHGGMNNMITKRLTLRPRVVRQKMRAGAWT